MSLWDLLHSGYSLTVDGTTFIARKKLMVDGVECYKSGTADASFPVIIVASVCVSILIVLVGVLLCYRNRQASNHSNKTWQRIKITTIDSRLVT